MTAIRPRRSVLYMPGSNARALDKARGLDADALILDLEDAVAPEAKETARAQVVEAVRARGFGAREVIVRVNALSTPWGEDDLFEAAEAGPDAILIPKVDGPDDLEDAVELLGEAEVPEHLALWAMIETPRAIFAVERIAAEGREMGLAAFVMGTNDLVKEMGGRHMATRENLLGALGLAVLAARAHGLAAIDGVYNDIADTQGFEAVCRQGRDFGFDGKTLIHPAQIEPANRIFAPSEADIADARAILDAFALPGNADKGAIALNGRMVERLHAEIAARVVALAEAIAARG